MAETAVYFVLLVAYTVAAIFLWKWMYRGIQSGSTQLSRLRCAAWSGVTAFALITAMAGIILRVYEAAMRYFLR